MSDKKNRKSQLILKYLSIENFLIIVKTPCFKSFKLIDNQILISKKKNLYIKF